LLPLHIQKSHALEETYKVIPHNFLMVLLFKIVQNSSVLFKIVQC